MRAIMARYLIRGVEWRGARSFGGVDPAERSRWPGEETALMCAPRGRERESGGAEIMR